MFNPLILASKELYLWLVHLTSKRTKKNNDKIVFLLSFPTASKPALQLLYENFPEKLVICYTKNSKELASYYERRGCSTYCIDEFPTLLKNIVPIVTGCKLVFCDNYFAFLAGITFSFSTKVVQLWHANGAIKSFGLAAEYAKKASEKDRKRYSEVYEKFTHYVVSSKKMADIFAKSYRQNINKLPFGYLSTDLFADQYWLSETRKQFKNYFPRDKKVVLYVPTYREYKTSLPLDFAKLQQHLGDEWQIMVKAHPHDEEFYSKIKNESQIITDFKGLDLVQILPSVDCLITDYSSVPFEYSLANPKGKIVFFCYDYDEYNKEVGVEENFESWAPGAIVTNEEALISEVQCSSKQNFTSFNQMWNEYVQGNARKQLLEWVRKVYDN
ncbi:CDP-glycerol glycerophosphotransferase family protein [Tetragenococcus koreensis]|uniref:CDP-glycerol glycerophosphotransferase family protein n=1 Tax=Tetragenococcus koreensis TaxID=290335 RepID=UPI001F1985ED|nr:CDP-glycerol glycerophosphotransferase family protein [Tetragenococcus koreensis]MDN6571974.1 CDP-glycerol glycerophosphotransferase family protein [Staphylococcus equorum]MDN6641048.1 CDP-glycerol glycerophosphotransferase family protein [Tetragenococcus sp.]MDN6840466.1 CDP-glycerol glycerophosphotransferase family protein [Tetragenococcus halophilus]MCF1619447.1 CDP-glycerol glycerophosphotransferase family protein [Tetragenococcus koreensis]MCF1622050.1 CDP-glycerol glycerophosphotransf